MGDYFQSTNINASNFYKNGKPINLGGQGAQGATGAQGTTGTQGATGAQGTTGAQGATSGGELPVGSVVMWPLTQQPPNWLFCNNQKIPSKYTALLALMKTNLTPDFRGRFPAMSGSHTGAVEYIGALGTKTDTHSLNIYQMPPHEHEITVTLNPPKKSTGFSGVGSFTNEMPSYTGSASPFEATTVLGTGSNCNDDDACKSSIIFGKDGKPTGTNITGGEPNNKGVNVIKPYAPPYYSINFIIYAGAPTL